MIRHALVPALAAMLLSLPAGGSLAKTRSAADEALLKRAIKECNGPHYPSGARMVINYEKGTFKCVETNSSRR
jgi:hypothetical protein